MSLDIGEQTVKRRKCIIVTLLAAGIAGTAYLAGLSYCASIHGLGYYGANCGPAPTLPPTWLRRIYDPSLRAVARYYRWRGNRGLCPDQPLDIRVLTRILFVHAWGTPACSRPPYLQRVAEDQARDRRAVHSVKTDTPQELALGVPDRAPDVLPHDHQTTSVAPIAGETNRDVHGVLTPGGHAATNTSFEGAYPIERLKRICDRFRDAFALANAGNVAGQVDMLLDEDRWVRNMALHLLRDDTDLRTLSPALAQIDPWMDPEALRPFVAELRQAAPGALRERLKLDEASLREVAVVEQREHYALDHLEGCAAQRMKEAGDREGLLVLLTMLQYGADGDSHLKPETVT